MKMKLLQKNFITKNRKDSMSRKKKSVEINLKDISSDPETYELWMVNIILERLKRMLNVIFLL